MGEQEFKIGDVVRLRSGGPQMTILEVNGDWEDSLQCVWFTGEDLIEEYWFCPSMVIKRNLD